MTDFTSFLGFGGGGDTFDTFDPGDDFTQVVADREAGILTPSGSTAFGPSVAAPSGLGLNIGGLLRSSGQFLRDFGVPAILGGGATVINIRNVEAESRAQMEEFFFEGRQALLAEEAAALQGREGRIQIAEQLEEGLARIRAAGPALGRGVSGSPRALLDFTAAGARKAQQNVDINAGLTAGAFRIDAANSFASRRRIRQQADVREAGLMSDFFGGLVDRVS